MEMLTEYRNFAKIEKKDTKSIITDNEENFVNHCLDSLCHRH